MQALRLQRLQEHPPQESCQSSIFPENHQDMAHQIRGLDKIIGGTTLESSTISTRTLGEKKNVRYV